MQTQAPSLEEGKIMIEVQRRALSIFILFFIWKDAYDSFGSDPMGFEDAEDKSFGSSLKDGVMDAGNWVGRQSDALGQGFDSMKERIGQSDIQKDVKAGFFGGWGKVKLVLCLGEIEI
jgi:hypothetical protein